MRCCFLRPLLDGRLTSVVVLLVILITGRTAEAAKRYVSPTGMHIPPFLGWAQAATNIQAAVDVCSPGDRVWVTNGVYDTGGVGSYAGGSNRVAVTKAITVSSVNGPEVTLIVGSRDPDSANGLGPKAIRGVYLAPNAVMAGFTITNGSASGGGGGAFCETSAVISNCIFKANSANEGGGIFSPEAFYSVLAIARNCLFLTNSASYGGAAYNVRLEQCTLTGNSAMNSGRGGATLGCELVDCTVTANRAISAGGSSGGSVTNCIFAFNESFGGGGAMAEVKYVVGSLILSNSAVVAGGIHGPGSVIACTILGNTGGGVARGITAQDSVLSGNTSNFGGGAHDANLTNCLLLSNSASVGGGAEMCSLHRCVLMGNKATYGGGARNSFLQSCLVLKNHAEKAGGGVDEFCVLNCTVVSNTCAGGGGGVSNARITNSIVIYNSALDDDNILTPDYLPKPEFTCTHPLPSGGFNNLDADPLFVDPASDNFRLHPGSPCVNAGTNLPYLNVDPLDRDGRVRIMDQIVDLGAYELNLGISGKFIAWLGHHGLPTNGSADTADTDLDGFDNLHEWLSGTTPTNRNSFPRPAPRLLSCTLANGAVALTWQSDPDAPYSLECATNLNGAPFEIVASGIVGQAGATTFLHTNAASVPSRFYRIRLD